MSLLYFLLIGLAAGWLTSQIMAGGRFGLPAMLIVGVVGSFLGGMVIRLLGFSSNSIISELITATIGAVLLVVLLRKFAG